MIRIWNKKVFTEGNILTKALCLLFIFSFGSGCGNLKTGNNCSRSNMIEVWYGDEQSFGTIGNPQRCINILGCINYKDTIREVFYSLNQGEKTILSIGRNENRLANPGDFNVEIDRKLLLQGVNELIISAVGNEQDTCRKQVTIKYYPDNIWPLPYLIKWENVEKIQDVVQVVDGKWELTPEGIHIAEPYYDRILAVGDSTWINYEVTVAVKFHSFSSPSEGPPTYGVSHAAIALRWPGHDADHHQPNVKWYPLGATCEFKLFDNMDTCRFRIIGDYNLFNEKALVRHSVMLNRWYEMKVRVESVGDNTFYSAKFWETSNPEPLNWDIISKEGKSDIQQGSALLISHNSEVTFGCIYAEPI